VLGENPAQSEADVNHAVRLLEGLDHLVVQDIFMTRTAELADVVSLEPSYLHGRLWEENPERRGRHLGVGEGERVRVTSRRGSVVANVRLDTGLRPGLAFMTMHFPDEVDLNRLTIEATDPTSGTAEFKASAVRVGAEGADTTSLGEDDRPPPASSG
jgi:predicted molibdopterin-dependent oxidoreductase YjgC